MLGQADLPALEEGYRFYFGLYGVAIEPARVNSFYQGEGFKFICFRLQVKAWQSERDGIFCYFYIYTPLESTPAKSLRGCPIPNNGVGDALR